MFFGYNDGHRSLLSYQDTSLRAVYRSQKYYRFFCILLLLFDLLTGVDVAFWGIIFIILGHCLIVFSSTTNWPLTGLYFCVLFFSFVKYYFILGVLLSGFYYFQYSAYQEILSCPELSINGLEDFNVLDTSTKKKIEVNLPFLNKGQQLKFNNLINYFYHIIKKEYESILFSYDNFKDFLREFKK